MISGGFQRFKRLELVRLFDDKSRFVVHHFDTAVRDGSASVESIQLRFPNRIRLDSYAEPERRTIARQSQRKRRCNLPTISAEEPQKKPLEIDVSSGFRIAGMSEQHGAKEGEDP